MSSIKTITARSGLALGQPSSARRLTGSAVTRLMRQHGKTIRGLAAEMNITQARVRRVRAHGVEGFAYVQDWTQAITGQVPQ